MPKFLVTLSKKKLKEIKRFFLDQYEFDKDDFPTDDLVIKELFFLDGDPRFGPGDFRDNVKVKEVKDETLPWDLCKVPSTNSKAGDKA